MGIDYGFDVEPEREETKTETAVALSKNALQNAKQQFEKYRGMIENLKDEVEYFEVRTDQDAANLTAALGKVATLINQVEGHRKEIIKPQDAFVRGVNSFVKSFRDILNSITRIGKQKIGEHSRIKELERRANERKLEEARRAEQKWLDEMAKKEGVKAPVVPKMVAPIETKPIRTDTGSSSTKVVWTWRVEQLGKVPRQYLMEDKHALAKAIDAGIRNIPGVAIFEKPKVMIRRR